jgi:FixJ family two-component response regulator
LEAKVQALRARYALLTRREREVMALVVSGQLNKRVGSELGISEITVQAHRGKVMRKMKADSLASLVRMAANLRQNADSSCCLTCGANSLRLTAVF